jgi:hypothetical protein
MPRTTENNITLPAPEPAMESVPEATVEVAAEPTVSATPNPLPPAAGATSSAKVRLKEDSPLRACECGGVTWERGEWQIVDRETADYVLTNPLFEEAS